MEEIKRRKVKQRSNQEKEVNTVDWSRLPDDLIIRVADHIVAVDDFINFRAVCTAWRFAVPKTHWKPKAPCLFLKKYHTPSMVLKVFSCTNNKKIYTCKPVSQTDFKSRIWGSQTGWIFSENQLINPLTQAKITLPAFNRLIRKALVFETLHVHGTMHIIVMVIYGSGKQVALAMSGYKEWILVKDDYHINNADGTSTGFEDIVSYGDRVFGVRRDGTLVLFNMDEISFPEAKNFALPPDQLGQVDGIYLVESAGDLLIITEQRCCVSIVIFEVYKFNFDAKGWIKSDDLGNRALFIGHNYSMSLSALNDDVYDHCKGDHIYFTKYNGIQEGQCMFVFNMKNKIMEVHYLCNDRCMDQCFDFFWSIPSLR